MKRLTDDEIARGLVERPWERDGDAIVRAFEFDDFARAIAFVTRGAEAAEEADHHPDILVHGSNKVRLTFSTHSEGGITQADLDMAATVDGLT
jgi:4a-hydroxytetrahydrobiopterin dehydratase